VSEERKAAAEAVPGEGEAGAAIVKLKEGLTPRELAYAFAASGYFPGVRKVSQALTKIVAGAELGFGPMASVNGIHLIDGRLFIGAGLLAAKVKRSADYDYRIVELTNSRCTLRFFERRARKWEPLTPDVTYTIQDAAVAGVVRSKSGWEKFPANMLFAAAMRNGVRFHCPHLTGGVPLYGPEDFGDVIEGEFADLGGGELAAQDSVAQAVHSGDLAEEPEFEDQAFPAAPAAEGGPLAEQPPTVPAFPPRLPNQWEEEIIVRGVHLGLAENRYAAVAILNRSPFADRRFGALELREGLGWMVAWAEVTEELGKERLSTERAQEALSRWAARADEYEQRAQAMGI
jgi:hypothetical protein